MTTRPRPDEEVFDEQKARDDYNRNARQEAAGADDLFNSSRYVDYDGNLIEYRTGRVITYVGNRSTGK